MKKLYSQCSDIIITSATLLSKADLAQIVAGIRPPALVSPALNLPDVPDRYANGTWTPVLGSASTLASHHTSGPWGMHTYIIGSVSGTMPWGSY